MEAFQLDGNIGERVVIAAVTTSGALDTCITLYPPDGGPPEANTCGYCGITGGGDLLDHQLQKTGLYTIVVKDNCLSNSGTYNISFLKIPGAVSSPEDLDGGAIASGETLIGTINVASDVDAFQFYGQALDRAVITVVTTSGALDTCITLYPPDGGPPEANTCGYCGITGGGDLLDHQLQQTGLYTIVVKDNCLSNSGTYNISLTKIPSDVRPGIYNPSPSDRDIVCDFSGSFSWDLVLGATGYDLYFGKNVVEPLVQIGDNLQTSSMPFPTMVSGNIYYWHVVAHTPTGDIQGPYWWFETTDCTPPTPNPMTWATPPNQTGTTSISMVATTATDPTAPISYYFDFVDSPTGGTGGLDSDWQLGTSYTNSGLQPNHQYGYRVKARDGANNETEYSTPIWYVYIAANTPGVASFSDVTETCIRSNWTANGNPSGTQYYCENTTAGTNSGWITSNSWDSCGLTCGTSYNFRVKARNGDGIETGWTSLGSQSAQACPDTMSPSLSITSHSDGQHVNTSNITLIGTASDSGRGDNGIQQVTVNGVRADNDTAAGGGTANWSKVVSLNPGANSITVVAYDNSSNHNQTPKIITIYREVCAISYTLTVIDYPGALGTTPSRINNSDTIVGCYADQALVYHGFIYNGSWTTIDFPEAYQTWLSGINNLGKIVGSYTHSISDSLGHGFLYDNGNWTILDFPGAIQTIATDINDAGVIVGYYSDANGEGHGFLYDGSWTTLDFPGFSYTVANGINNFNKIVGQYNESFVQHGFLYDGSYHTIAYAYNTYAYGINNFDKIVGTYYDGMGAYIALIYDGTNFSTYSYSTATVFRGINDAGKIVGNYSSYLEGHGFVLTPAETCPPGRAPFSNVSQTCIQANWTANGNPTGTQYFCENMTNGVNSGWTTDLYWLSCELNCGTSYSFQVMARNSDGIQTGWTSLGSQSTQACPDTTPPTPNPMTWATPPNKTGTTSISMVATTATDPTTPINYFFDFTSSPTGGTGGANSSWQSGTSYTDAGLQPNHQYGYQVKAKDGANNETGYSTPIWYVYTAIEAPTGITFGTITPTNIQVQSTNTPSGLTRGSSGLLVENTTNGTNSGWRQDNSFWSSGSLFPNTSYSFRAKARNGDTLETDYCSSISRYTLANVPGAASFSNVTQTCIRANWTINGNPSGTEYYCENITAGTNSGWTTITSWDSCSLTCGTSYNFRVKSRNGDGIETNWNSLNSQSTLVCDTTPPETTITDGPSGTITTNHATFTFTGSDNVTLTTNLVYATYLEGYDSGWSTFSSSTTKSYSNLPNGPYIFHVKARDEMGNEDLSPATRLFTVWVLSGLVNLPQTGQKVSYAPRDDGELQMGVVWPIPRFTDNGNGTITDHLTGLIWTKDANLSGGSKTWQEALDYVKGMNAGTNPNFGFTGWRLPNINELESFINAGETNLATWLSTRGFINVQNGFYWSSTTYTGLTNSAWIMFMYPGSLETLGKTANLSFWPVRGTTTAPAQLWKTGQTKCYDTSGSEIVCNNTGQDGELQAGTKWPIQKFTVGSECVTDNLTGLVWVKNANLAGSSKTWRETIDYVASINNGGGLCGFMDWRVPNIKELRTLVDYSEHNPPLPSDHPFTSVQTGFYWSSTTSAVLTNTAWSVFMLDGSTGTLGKNAALSVWPVRGGHHKRDEIMGAGGNWSSGIWYYNLATNAWSKPYGYTPSGPIAIGDVNGDGKGEMVSCWPSGLWYQNGATLGWTKVFGTAPSKVAAGDITGDGRAEIIGTWNSGIWYWNPATSGWTQMYNYVPSGPIAAGDVTGDGRADGVSCWPSGLWYQDGATLGWTKVFGTAPSKVAAGDITGDGRAEIIGTWSSGIWYWNPATSGWTQMYNYVPSGPIAAGDVTGDGRADGVSCWPSGLWYQDGATLGWTKVYSVAPSKIAVGDIPGN